MKVRAEGETEIDIQSWIYLPIRVGKKSIDRTLFTADDYTKEAAMTDEKTQDRFLGVKFKLSSTVEKIVPLSFSGSSGRPQLN